MVARPDGDLVDLHIHSTASDGTDDARSILEKASDLGLRAIAITDHDSVGMVRSAINLAPEYGVEFIPGVEIGVAHDRKRGLIDIDILGYFVSPEDPQLLTALERLQESKNQKLDSQLDTLRKAGFPIEKEDVLREAGGDTIRRPHIWKVLHRHHPNLPAEVFFAETTFGGNWYVPKTFSLSLEETARILQEAGGISFVAHPGAYNSTFAESGQLIDPAGDAVIRTCAKAGVVGVEVEYPYWKGRPFFKDDPLISRQEQGSLVQHYEVMAEELGLLKSGGSDYHGTRKPELEMGEVRVPYQWVEAMKRVVPAR